MQVTEGIPWRAPLIVGGTLVLASALAVLVAWSNVSHARTLSAAPRATLAAPVPGPAVYRGGLFSSVARATPRGTRGAAFWWWVGKTGKNRRTSCTQLVSDKLVLRDAGNEVKVEMFDDRLGVSLLADGRSEWSEGRIIELGSAPVFSGDIPVAAGNCSGNEYQERVIAEGTSVEILGCYGDGELRACPGAFAGVLSVPTLSVHTWRRAQRAHIALRAVAVLGALALVVLGLRARRLRARRHATELRPEHRT
ncbi:MAG: hypothetical protein IT377_12305 [Polyangiaceae bacterium]|nr:hypothetical protein [Polyangiaceae bacterium]